GKLRTPGAEQREERRDCEHDASLSDFDAGIEGEKRPGEGLSWQPELAQHAREAEAVHEAEAGGDRRAAVALAVRPTQQVVDSDIDDAERDDRLDEPRRWSHEPCGGEGERDAVRDRERRDDLEEARQPP